MPKEEFEYKGYKMRRVEVEEENEFWNEYELEDGTTLRVKLILSQAAKSVDKPKDSSGEPLYSVKTDTVVDAIVPEDQYFKDEEGEEG
ncbi:MAG: hypothetical protein ABEI54_04135 [Candidatus Bipolaricaulia bacterium]